MRKQSVSIFIQKILILIMLLWFLIFLMMPMVMMFGQVFTDDLGNWVEIDNFVEYFSNPLLSSSIFHSLYVSIMTALISSILGIMFAYGVRRQITIGHNSKLNFRLTSIRPRGLTGNCTFLSA